jgi:hypothetical protein
VVFESPEDPANGIPVDVSLRSHVDGAPDDLDLVTLGDGHPLKALEPVVQAHGILVGHVDLDPV